jgi:hypothetical protein
MSSAAFKALAKTLISEGDAALLETVELEPQPLKQGDKSPSYANKALASGSGFIDGWREWERTLRLNVARHRAIKSNHEELILVEPPMFPIDAATAAVKAVIATESPLAGEILIDKARWNAIDVLQGFDYFGRDSIFAYLLKLILLERQEKFKTEEGFTEYKSLYASILGSAQSGTRVGEPK